MKSKKCCYMDRECTPVCVAYSTANELGEGARDMGMSDMHCIRLLSDLTNMIKGYSMDAEDEEDEF